MIKSTGWICCEFIGEQGPGVTLYVNSMEKPEKTTPATKYQN
jgi:hypothetical protein